MNNKNPATRLGIVVSHPIQYYAPLFRFLAARMDLIVLYGFVPTPAQVGSIGFGVAVDWGVDLLSGYPYKILPNRAQEPTSARFSGFDVPHLMRELASVCVTHVVIFGWQLKAYWQALIACLRSGIPVAVRGDSRIDPREPRWKTLARRSLYPLFLRRYSRVFYVGRRNRDYLLANGADPESLLFAPHAVDQSFWTPRSTASPGERPVRFVWVAKFIAKKRPLDAIAAFRMAAQRDPDIELVMVGTGELQEPCRREATGEARIRFAGVLNQPRLRELFAEADCLVLTSDYGETWGLVVNEAMASGLPAIVSDACGCEADLIDDDATGYRYRVGDLEQLAARMLRMAARLRHDGAHFRRAIEAKNLRYSFATNWHAFAEFVACTRPVQLR